MAFIVIAPGIRDVVSTAEVFAGRPLKEIQRPARIRRTPGINAEHPPAEQQMLNQGPHARERYEETAELPHERVPALLAEQIMSAPVVTMDAGASMDQAWALFHEHRFRHVPVIGPDHRILGILSDRDLLCDAAGIGVAAGKPHTTIRPIMVTRVVTATANTEIREIARVLHDRHIGAMPIVNEADSPIGIVSRSDILQALVTHAPLELWV